MINKTVEQFVLENIEYTQEYSDIITSETLYTMFLDWCKKNKQRNLSRCCFTQAAKKIVNSDYILIKTNKKVERGFRYIKKRTGV